MPHTWKGRASRVAPRLLALTWSVFAASRIAAYIDTSPPQLSVVAALLPLWAPWAVAAVLLALGGLVPSGAGEQSKQVARLMRQWGMTIVFGLLLVWAAAFLVADFHRGWVTGGSYAMLVIFAGWSGWVASRDLADVRVVREGEANAGVAE